MIIVKIYPVILYVIGVVQDSVEGFGEVDRGLIRVHRIVALHRVHQTGFKRASAQQSITVHRLILPRLGSVFAPEIETANATTFGELPRVIPARSIRGARFDCYIRMLGHAL